MLPLLYSANTSVADALANNGLGFIKNCISCEVTEELNGGYELAAEVLTSDRLIAQIAEQDLLKVKPNAVDVPQLFTIYKTHAEDKSVQISAQHLRYRLFDNVLSEDVAFSDVTPAQAWAQVQEFLVYTNSFTFTSDITTQRSVTAAEQTPVRLGEFISGTEGSMLDAFGGELHYNNLSVQLLSSRGEETGIAIRCGGGINDLEYEVSSDSMYTDISPFAKIPTGERDSGGEIVVKGDMTVWLDPISTGNTVLQNPRALSYDFTENFANRYPNFKVLYIGAAPDPDSYAEARTKLTAVTNTYISQNAQRLRKPNINIKIDVSNADDRFKDCKLGDIISIFYEPLRLIKKAKIIRLKYDVLGEKYTEIELGDPKMRIANFFPNKNIGGV